MENIETKYKQILSDIQMAEKPVIFVNGCTHGHEKIGKFVIDELKKIKIKKGTLLTNIGNEKAFEKDVAFLESDLNRVFPGNKNGTYEEKIAYFMGPVIKKTDIVFDIHSTTTTVSENEAMVIVTKLDKKTLEYINIINPPRVLVMKYKNNNALISQAKVGLAFEYGNDTSEITLENTVNGIRKILSYLGMIDFNVDTKKVTALQTQFYEISDVLKKNNGYKLCDGISNFSLVKKDNKIATNGKDFVFATEDFYPILFGENRYVDIFGFIGKKIENPIKYSGTK